jgi:hypothetical protein
MTTPIAPTAEHLTGRAATTALFEIATAIAEGASAVAVQGKVSALLRATVPGIENVDNIAMLMAWGMYVQFTAAATAIERRLNLLQFALAVIDEAQSAIPELTPTDDFELRAAAFTELSFERAIRELDQ